MDEGIHWEGVENSCAENRELAEVLRWLERFHACDPSLDWKESRKRCADALYAFFEDSAKSRALSSELQGAEYEIGGDEHLVLRVDSQPERVFKLTHGDAFGCFPFFSPCDPELTGKHFHGSINEDPAYYLRRWMLLNSISDYVTRFEGVLPPESRGRMPRICISQPSLDAPNPTTKDIREALDFYGFEKVSEDAFLHFDDHILLTDAAPRNVRIIEGTPVLFDVIASIPESKVYQWAQSRLTPKNSE